MIWKIIIWFNEKIAWFIGFRNWEETKWKNIEELSQSKGRANK